MTLSLEEIEMLEALNEQGNLELVCFEEHIWPFAERTPATVFDTLLTMEKRSLELEAENAKLRETIAAQSKRIEDPEAYTKLLEDGHTETYLAAYHDASVKIRRQKARIEELEKRVEALKGLKQYIKHDGDLTWEAIGAILKL